MSATTGSSLAPASVNNDESFAVWTPGKADTVTAVLARAVEQSPDTVFLDFSGETFRAHQDIADVAVHAVPSELTEDDIKVTAVLRAGSKLTEHELCRWSLDRLPYFAVPRYIEFRTELPRNASGKVLKFQLRDEGVTAKTWDIESSDIEVVKR